MVWRDVQDVALKCVLAAHTALVDGVDLFVPNGQLRTGGGVCVCVCVLSALCMFAIRVKWVNGRYLYVYFVLTCSTLQVKLFRVAWH